MDFVTDNVNDRTAQHTFKEDLYRELQKWKRSASP